MKFECLSRSEAVILMVDARPFAVFYGEDAERLCDDEQKRLASLGGQHSLDVDKVVAFSLGAR